MNFKALSIFLCVFSLCVSMPVFCEEAGDWVTFNSGQLTIEYQNTVNLKAVAGKLGGRGLFSNGLFGSDRPSAATLEEEVVRRLERLLERAEEILDMYPPKLKLTVKIFNEGSSLEDAYFRIFGARKSYEAFYVYQYGTIYTSAYGISDSVMIHEIAHAVVDNYFSTNPPPKVSELLAQYVDVHLED